MPKKLVQSEDVKLKEKSDKFKTNLKADMRYKADISSDSMDLSWLETIESACPYIDYVVRHPKLDLINEEAIVKIEQAKRISVASVKHLAKHTDFIEKVDPVTEDVSPSKILIERREEAYNTYENRMVYTLMFNIGKIIGRKESLLEEFKTKNDKVLEYAASTNDGNEKIKIEIKMTSNQLSKGTDANDFINQIESIKARIRTIKRYLSSWRTSEFFRSIAKAGSGFVYSPIKKTNVLLSNTNYNTALNLFEYLESYDDSAYNKNDKNIDTSGDDLLRSLLNDSFLMDYYVLDSVCSSKRREKEKLSKYAVLMINQQLKNLISLLLNYGVDISEEEILKMVSVEMNTQRKQRLVGSKDVKNKFKEAIDKYIEGTQNYR